LSSATEEINKTRLRYKSNMSHIQFNKYLNVLIEKNLIFEKETDSMDKIYCITDNGLEFLKPLQMAINKLK
jgi:predicted transcriptional regulator